MKTSDKFRAALHPNHHKMPDVIAAGMIMDLLDEILVELRPKAVPAPVTAEKKK